MRAAIYARVSSAAQRERETIESQLRVLPAFVAAQGWTLVGTYVDDGHTAKAGHLAARVGLAAMLRDAALHLFDVVVVVDLDRLTRSEDLAERGQIYGALQQAGVKIASSTSGQVLDLSTSTGDLFSSLHAFFAAEWSRKHRERVTQGKLTAIARGYVPSGRPPYWLRFDKATGWRIDDVRGPLIVEAFERVAAGESCRAIADDLHARNAPKPRGEWSRSRVQRIVRSRAVLGEWVADRTRGLAVVVPRLIDDVLWQRAQDAMDVSGKRGLDKTRHEYLLQGLAVCGSCGAPMGIVSKIWDGRRGGRWSPAVYQCRGRRLRRLGAEGCTQPRIATGEADDRVWAAVVRELDDPALAEHLTRMAMESADDTRDWQADANGYRAHLARLDAVEARVLDRHRRDLISEDGFDAELGRLSRERAAVTSQLEACSRATISLGERQTKLDDAQRMLTDLRGALVDAAFVDRRKLLAMLAPTGSIVFSGKLIKATLWIPRVAAAVQRPRLVGRNESNRLHETSLRLRTVA